jgi:hypothetical protein
VDTSPIGLAAPRRPAVRPGPMRPAGRVIESPRYVVQLIVQLLASFSELIHALSQTPREVWQFFAPKGTYTMRRMIEPRWNALRFTGRPRRVQTVLRTKILFDPPGSFFSPVRLQFSPGIIRCRCQLDGEIKEVIRLAGEEQVGCPGINRGHCTSQSGGGRANH